MKPLIFGSAVIDEILYIDTLPEPGDDVECTLRKTSLGGCAYNTACMLRNLNIPHDLCTPIGTGDYAAEIEKRLHENGYNTMIKDLEKDNGHCICLVESDGERSFITINGVEIEIKKEWLENINIEEYSSICINGYQVCRESGDIVVSWLEEKWRDKKIFFAPGPQINDISEDIMKRILSLSPIMHINEKEAIEFTKENTLEKAIQEIYKITSNTVIVTIGFDGAMYIENGKISKVDGFKTEAVDTIGAGDGHIGAVIAGVESGFSIHDSIVLANKAASEIVKVSGAVISYDEFKKLGINI